MSDPRVKPNIDNGDLSKQLEFDFNKKDLEPIPFGNRKIEIKDMFNSNKLRAWFNEQNK